MEVVQNILKVAGNRFTTTQTVQTKNVVLKFILRL